MCGYRSHREGFEGFIITRLHSSISMKAAGILHTDSSPERKRMRKQDSASFTGLHVRRIG